MLNHNLMIQPERWHVQRDVCLRVLYFLSPVDLIPDFLPGIGQVDDITVLGFAVKATYEDLRKYDNWRKKKK